MDHQSWSPAVAFLVVAAAVTGVVAFGEDTPIEHVNPVGESDALAGASVVAIGAGFAIGSIAADYWQSDPTDELEQLDGQETRQTAYGSLETQQADYQVFNDSNSNYLEDTRTIARIEAKTAYIRALDNGSSEAVARTKAYGAVDDYYTDRQQSMLNQWEIQITHLETIHGQVKNETNVSSDYITIDSELEEPNDYSINSQSLNYDGHSKTLSLLNGSQETIPTVGWQYDSEIGASLSCSGTYEIEPTASDPTHTNNCGSETMHISPTRIWVHEHTSGVGDLTYLDLSPNSLGIHWSEIQSHRDQVVSEMDTFINNTYENWEAGTINVSDLVDPYLGAREFSPDAQYQTWSLRTLTSLGTSPPRNLSQFGNMTVEDHADNSTYTGILLSDGTPAGDSFQVGTMYNASNLAGSQFVQTTDSTYSLEGNFTISAAYNASGSALSSIDYRTINYSTSNLSDFKESQEQLQQLNAEINALQDQLRNSSGGGGAIFGDLFGGLFGGLGSTAKIVLIGGGVLVAARVFGGS